MQVAACDLRVVLCDTGDTSILIIDTYVTIPVSPRSRYTAVYRSSKNTVRRHKYREHRDTVQLVFVPLVNDNDCTLQACDAETKSQ